MKLDRLKIDDLYARVISMYRREGVVVKEITPLPHQSAAGFYKYARRQPRAAVGDKPIVVAITKKAWLLRHHSKLIGSKCGAVVYLPDDDFVRLGYVDVQLSVDTMTTHLHKVLRAPPGEDPNVCVVCQDAYKEVQCSRCFTSICKKCFVKTVIRQRDQVDSVKCVGCRNEVPLDYIFDNRTHTEVYTSEAYNDAILQGMREMGTKTTCLTVVDPEHNTIRDMRITCNKEYTNLQKHTDHARAVKKSLKRAGTVIMVGESPTMCDNCDRVHECDLDIGKVYVVDHDGVREMVDEFGMVGVFLRSIL